MNRLGIDYGEKRWGLSFSDDLGIATPMPAITSLDIEQKWEHLARVVKERRVQAFVVGYPLNMDGTVGFKASEVDRFVTQIRERFEGRSVYLVDERLTSELAGEGWSEKKKRQERQSGKLDSRAATLILQDYLDQQGPPLVELDEDGLYED
jgi:putative holliday junction resolvase